MDEIKIKLASKIERLTRQASFERAQKIAKRESMFRNKEVSYIAGSTCLYANVVGSSPDNLPYTTCLQIDEETGTIEDFECTCPAYYNYDGLCKHCAALALNYLENPQSFEGWRDASLFSSCNLHKMINHEQTLIEEKNAPGSVCLEPHFTLDRGCWSVDFRLSQNGKKPYVVKKVGNFAEAVLNSEFYSYGKDLAFVHNISMFDDDSKAIINVLMEILDDEYSIKYFRENYWESRLSNLRRYLVLDDFEVISMFKAMEKMKFGVTRRCGWHSVGKLMEIEKSDPVISIEIKKKESRWEITTKDDFDVVYSGNDLYIWKHDADRLYAPKETLHKCSKDFVEIAEFLQCLKEDLKAGCAYFSEHELPIFCSFVLPKLEKVISVKGTDELAEFRPKPCKLKFYFDKRDQKVTIAASANYGEISIPLIGTPPVEGDEKTELGYGSIRDFEAERRAIQLINEFFWYGEPYLREHDSDSLGNLIFNGLDKFSEAGEVYTTPSFEKLLGAENPKVDVEVSIQKGVLKLDISSAELTNEEIAQVLKSYHEKRKYHLLKNGALVDVDALELDELDDLSKGLDLTDKDIKKGTLELPKYRAFYFDTLSKVAKDKSFDEYIKKLKQTEKKKKSVPKSLEKTLRPYQKKGFEWLKSRVDAGFGGILADEMGLGKSLQLITLILATKKEADAPSLIVCPSSLVYNWKAEFERFAPELNVAVVAGKASERASTIENVFEEWHKDKKKRTDVVITSYDLARIDVEAYAEHSFYIMAIDEAQYIKNHNTQKTKAIKRIGSVHRFALTGTPIENRLSELWSIFDFLMPGILGNRARFKKNFEKPIADGNQVAQKRLQNLIGPFILRRCKSDVLKDLPDKIESVVYTEMGKEQTKLYQSFEKRLAVFLEESKKKKTNKKQNTLEPPKSREVSKLEVLAELTKLREVCCDPRLLFDDYKDKGSKIETILELIDSSIETGQKVLVFSQFTSYLKLIEKELKAQKIGYYKITGQTQKKKRLDLVNAFNEDDTPVFLISLKAGGTGLNLVGASVVIHADPWWNDAAQQQATDRAHRIGQKRVVSVLKVIAKDTIEERILKLQETKKALSDEFVKSGQVSLSSLTEQDLLALLQP